MKNQASTVLVTVMGRDKPGVTSALMATLSEYNAVLLDVEQVVIRGRLILAVLIERLTRCGQLVTAIEEKMATVGMDVDIEIGSDPVGSTPFNTHSIVILGKPITAEAFSRIAGALAEMGVNIDIINGIADYPVTGLRLEVMGRDASGQRISGVRRRLAELSNELGVDIAFEPNVLSRRAQRLIVFDVDSTLIQGEVIEMLAAHAGKEAEVKEITDRAMHGEIDFAESLRERVATLEGMPASIIDEVAANIKLTPGARTTIRTLQRLGFKCGIVSGGFTQVVKTLAEELKFDFVRANVLEIKDGKLTGKVVGEIVDREGKAKALREFAEQERVELSQTIAVGDGANDIDMLNTAGMGIAFNAKPALRTVADNSVNFPYLDEILFMLGITCSEVEALANHEDV
ncbi:MAG TPA: phosphoserine phosphatase SerB [Corynebacteriales bacterium]|nr:phosphoserine phosphatase SerB [Mycobacteriales bacterium]